MPVIAPHNLWKFCCFFMMAWAFLNKFASGCLSLCFKEESALPVTLASLLFRFLTGSGNLCSNDVYIWFRMVDNSWYCSVWSSFYECVALNTVGLAIMILIGLDTAIMILIGLDTKFAYHSVIVGENELWTSFLPFLTQLSFFSVIIFFCQISVSAFRFDPSTNSKPTLGKVTALGIN